MVSLPEKDCVGCASCANICPVNAISMQPDDEGFLYPVLNKGICINCDECSNHCPVFSGVADDFNNSKEPLAVYSGWSLDEETRLTSSSGGIFTELAKSVLKQGGYVVAVTYTEEHTAKHVIINSIAELEELKRSKYLQSDIGDIYQQIKHLLEKSEKVLFVGTPCQCAGLLAFLESKPDNLILVDFICHGVNSPLVHQRYILEVEQELKIKVKQISHRDKYLGWDDYLFSVSDSQKYYLGNKRQNPFLRGFLTDAYLRQTCFKCSFKGQIRPVDLTLGDCWGERETNGNNQGVSVIIVNSPIGKLILSEIDGKIYLSEYNIDLIIKNNPSIVFSANNKFKLREKFFEQWEKDASLKRVISGFLG